MADNRLQVVRLCKSRRRSQSRRVPVFLILGLSKADSDAKHPGGEQDSARIWKSKDGHVFFRATWLDRDARDRSFGDKFWFDEIVEHHGLS